MCATALSDAILQFFQEFIASANADDLWVAAQSNSLPPEGHDGRLREMFDPLLCFVAFVTILSEYRSGDISFAWSAYTVCACGRTRDRNSLSFSRGDLSEGSLSHKLGYVFLFFFFSGEILLYQFLVPDGITVLLITELADRPY